MDEQASYYAKEFHSTDGKVRLTIYIVGPFAVYDKQFREDYGHDELQADDRIVKKIWKELVAWQRFSRTWPGVGDEVWHLRGDLLFRVIHRTFNSKIEETGSPCTLTYWVEERKPHANLI